MNNRILKQENNNIIIENYNSGFKLLFLSTFINIIIINHKIKSNNCF